MPQYRRIGRFIFLMIVTFIPNKCGNYLNERGFFRLRITTLDHSLRLEEWPDGDVNLHSPQILIKAFLFLRFLDRTLHNLTKYHSK